MNQQNHHRILTECLQFLTTKGIDIEGAIEEIIRYFFAKDNHISYDDLAQFAIDKNLNIISEDIKKTLDLLVEYGFAEKKYFEEGKLLYEHLHLDEHHDHLYCIKCGRIEEFYSSGIEELQAVQAGKHGFHVFSHKLLIRGLCEQCFGKEADMLLPLAMVQTGGMFQIMQIGSGGNRKHSRFNKRIMDLGLIKGCNGEVISNGIGGLVLNIGGSRIAIGKGQGMKIIVSLKN